MQLSGVRVLGLGAAIGLFLVGVVVGRVTAPEHRTSGIQGSVKFGGCTGASGCYFVPQSACQIVRKGMDGDYDSRAELVARVCSGEDGRYRVSVPPGKYYIEPDNDKYVGLLKSSGPVDVLRGGYTSWNLVYDNGAR
jgi:hypothetical protein